MGEKTRLYNEIINDKYNDQCVPTKTTDEQKTVECTIDELFQTFNSVNVYDPDAPRLLRNRHISFLQKALNYLEKSYECLDCSRPWLCYWITHSLYLLDHSFKDEVIQGVSNFLRKCQSLDGGFGGGPGQYPHLAPTYAAVCALCTLDSTYAFDVINREKLVDFLWSIKNPNGSFNMHVGGEVDIRGLYCALSVARLTNCYSDALFENSAEWIASCQTYEGGFAGMPGLEAHGGYSFCGLAALILLNKSRLCDLKALLRWLVNRQMKFEGGFQGRPNKLVDGCYSFWIGGVFPIIHGLLMNEEKKDFCNDTWLYHQEALQEYLLICCQHEMGGLIDKPYKSRDIYHTCYGLSGLSVAQHSKKKVVIGSEDNELAPIHPLYNVNPKAVENAFCYFQSLAVPLGSFCNK